MMIVRILILVLLGMACAQGEELLERQRSDIALLFPLEIQADIFSFVDDLEDLERCRRVCKPWRQLIDQDVEGGFVLQCLRDFFRKGDAAQSAEEFKKIFLIKDRNEQTVLMNIINELQEELRLTSKKKAYEVLLESRMIQSCSGMRVILGNLEILKKVAFPYIPLNLFEEKTLDKAFKGRGITIAIKKIKQDRGIPQIFAMHNILQSFPAKLVELNLSNLNLTTLSKQIQTLPDLQKLCLSSNLLSRVPPEIGGLINLQELWANNNKLKDLPAEIGGLSKLRLLSLRDNQMNSVPPQIGQLINLEELNLSNNYLDSIPPEVGNLMNLQRLWLNNNELKELPARIRYLSRLKILSLCDNQLVIVPPEIKQLTNLQELYLRNNMLSSLPFKRDELPLLVILDLKDNPMNKKLPERHCTVS